MPSGLRIIGHLSAAGRPMAMSNAGTRCCLLSVRGRTGDSAQVTVTARTRGKRYFQLADVREPSHCPTMLRPQKKHSVYDLRQLKGKRCLTHVHVKSPDEAAAAEAAQIDLLSCSLTPRNRRHDCRCLWPRRPQVSSPEQLHMGWPRLKRPSASASARSNSAPARSIVPPVRGS